MTRQEQVDKLDKAMICDCDKYGHAHTAAGDIAPFSIRIELQCLNGPSADRFGHVCRSKIVMARESGRGDGIEKARHYPRHRTESRPTNVIDVNSRFKMDTRCVVIELVEG